MGCLRAGVVHMFQCAPDKRFLSLGRFGFRGSGFLQGCFKGSLQTVKCDGPYVSVSSRDHVLADDVDFLAAINANGLDLHSWTPLNPKSHERKP